MRILLLKPDHLGDLLLATPALTRLRRALPHAHITGLVGPWSQAIWRDNPNLDRLETLPFPGFDRNASPQRGLLARVQPYRLLLREAHRLRAAHYDAALLLRDDHYWGAMLAAAAGIPVRLGHAHPRTRRWLTHSVPFDPHQHVTRQAWTVVETFLASQGLAQTERAERFPLHYQPPQPARAWAAQWVATHVKTEQHLVIIHPGTGGPNKHWLVERWIALAKLLLARPNLVLALTGGPGEGALTAAIRTGLAEAIHDLAEQLSLDQSVALMAHAALVLGCDSGPLHLAVAQGVPTIHLFGPSDHVRFGPWGDEGRQRVVRAGLACSPCGVFAACPRHTQPIECMAAIGAEEVFALAEAALS